MTVVVQPSCTLTCIFAGNGCCVSCMRSRIYWPTMAAVQNGNRCVSSPQGSTRCTTIEKWDLMHAVCCLHCIVRVGTRALLDVKMGRTYIRYSMKWQHGVTGRTLANDPAPSSGQCASLPPRLPRLSRTMVSHAAIVVPWSNLTMHRSNTWTVCPQRRIYSRNDKEKRIQARVLKKGYEAFFFSSRAAGLH